MPTSDPWPPADPAERRKLLARLAQAHFVDGTSKVALATEAALSRFQVAALLQEAQDTGIVRVEIVLPHDDADAHLAAALGIRRVITVGTARWPADRRALAQAAAIASLDSGDELLARTDAVVAERERVGDALRELGHVVPESQANFLWLNLGVDAVAFDEHCLGHKVVARCFAGDGVRVTVTTPAEDDLFLAAARDWRGPLAR